MVKITPLASSSLGNCYHITDGLTALLVECGVPFREIRKKLNFKTSEIAGCLITHEHQDHCSALSDVLRAGISAYASAGTITGVNVSHHRLNPVEPLVPFKIDTWKVLPFETEHNTNEPLGFLLASKTGAKVLFATDTYYVRYKFQGLTHIMIECNFSNDILRKNVASGDVPRHVSRRLLKAHFSLENVKEFFKANDISEVREIWLLHLSNKNADAARFKSEIQAITGKPVYIA